MISHIRLGACTLVFAWASGMALARHSSAEPNRATQTKQLCYDIGLPHSTQHEFGEYGFMCECAPGTCHAEPEFGYCNEYHDGCPQQ